jgi:hypothetical protein
MTDIEKEKIRYLRGEGLGYKVIASRLELSVAAVKGFCQRNKLDGVAAENADNICRQCGQALGEKMPGAEGKKFCSAACRNAWWNRHAYLREPNEKDRHVCIHCGRVFYSDKSKARKYCGHPCYIKARFGEVSGHDAGTIRP